MSRLPPLALVDQMILFETLSALVYGFLWERPGPTIWKTPPLYWSSQACCHA
jgi:hypothetical protein